MKKLLCIFLAVILLCGVSAPMTSVVAAESELAKPADLLTALGIDVKIENPDAVTRSEFLYILMQILKYTPNTDAQIPFSDISTYDYYFPVIKYALDTGIISSNDKFYPLSEIKFQDACKMMISALGMDFVAKNKGGYPAGFLAAAKSCDLTEGIEVTDTLTKNAAIALFNNFLVTNTYSVISIKGNNPYYEVLDNSRTVLSLYYNIEKVTGIVTANRYTGLYDGNSFTSDNEIEIDEVVFKTIFDSKDYIGKRVDAYIHDNKTIVYMTSFETSIISLKTLDIVSVSNGKLTYYDGDKEKSLNLETTPATIYNGRADKSFKLSSLPSYTGIVEFVDNNSNGKYDVVSISSYRVLIVDSVNTAGECIFGMDNSLLRFDNDEAIYSFTKSGIEASPEDILSGELLQIYESKDNGIVSVKIDAGTKVSGVITESNIAAKKLYIDGAAYEYNQYFIDNHLSLVSIGDSVNVLLTDDGYIAALDSSESENDKWGYVIDIARASGLNDDVYIKMFSDNGQVEVITVAEKIVCDGTPKTSDGFYSWYNSNIALFGGLIRYNLNSENKLSMVDTAGGNGTLSPDSPSDDNNTEFILPSTIGSTAWFIKSSKMVAGCCNFSKAKIFIISPDETLDDKQRYALTDANYFVGNTSYPRTQVRAFNVSDSGEADAILISAAISTEINAETSPYAIVSSVTRGIDRDGNEGVILRVYYRDAYSKYYITDSEVLKQINAGATFDNPMIYEGDVLAFNANSNNSIVAMRKILDYKTKETPLGFGNVIQDNRAFGKVYAKSKSSLSILVSNKDGFTPDLGDPSKRLYFPMPHTVMVYDTKSGECYMGTSNEIISYLNDPVNCSEVLLIANDGIASEIILYK